MTEPPKSRWRLWLALPTRFPVTAALLALTLLGYSLQVALGGATHPGVSMRLGALSAARVVEFGEYYRLFMPMFLHGGILHLGLNGLAMFQLCLLTEHLFGRWTMLGVYLLSGLGAALCTTAMSAPWMDGSIGASGAILGLAGFLLGVSAYGVDPWKRVLRELLGRRLLYGVLLTFAIGLGLALVWPIVDNWGHFGGLMTGLALAVAHRVRFATPERRAIRRPSRATRAAVLGLCAATAISAVITWIDGAKALQGLDARLVERVHRRIAPLDDAGFYGLASEQLDDRGLSRAALALLERMLEERPDDPDAHNVLAWFLVTTDEPTLRDPARAEAQARRALALLDHEDAKTATARQRRAAFLDTRSEALIQLGRVSEAAPLQHQAVALAQQDDLPFRGDLEARLQRIEILLSGPEQSMGHTP